MQTLRIAVIKATASIACFLSLCLTSHFATARNLISDRPVDFAMQYQYLTTDLDYGDDKFDTRIWTLGASWYEVFSPRFHGGLKLGYVDVSQSDNPLEAAQTTSGYYLGIVLRTIAWQADAFQTDFNLEYAYYSTDGSQDTQNVDMNWHQFDFSLMGRYRLPAGLRLNGGVSYVLIDGEQRPSGPVSTNTDFDEDQKPSVHLGLSKEIEPDSHIGFEGFVGQRDGWLLSFQRWF